MVAWRSSTASLSGWNRLASAEGRFSVEFPKPPETKNIQGRMNDARFQDAAVFTAEKDGLAFMAAHSDEFDDIFAQFTTAQILDAARDGALSNIQGQLLYELSITKNGATGREVHFRVAGGVGSAADLPWLENGSTTWAYSVETERIPPALVNFSIRLNLPCHRVEGPRRNSAKGIEKARRAGKYKFFTVVKHLKTPANMVGLLRNWYGSCSRPLLNFSQQSVRPKFTEPRNDGPACASSFWRGVFKAGHSQYSIVSLLRPLGNPPPLSGNHCENQLKAKARCCLQKNVQFLGPAHTFSGREPRFFVHNKAPKLWHFVSFAIIRDAVEGLTKGELGQSGQLLNRGVGDNFLMPCSEYENRPNFVTARWFVCCGDPSLVSEVCNL